MLSAYLTKPVSRSERLLIQLILVALIPCLFLIGFAEFIFTDLDFCMNLSDLRTTDFYNKHILLCGGNTGPGNPVFGLLWIGFATTLALLGIKNVGKLAYVPTISLLFFNLFFGFVLFAYLNFSALSFFILLLYLFTVSLRTARGN